VTGLSDREWRLVREEARPGPMQMALDEVAAETAAAGGPRTARVYRWTPGTLSLGYRQAPGTVDWAFATDHDIDVTRRPTGGGGIYHDPVGDISYTIAVPADEVPGELLASYELLCGPILDALARMGVDAGFAEAKRPAVHEPACYLRAVDPAHDITAGGRKVSGNAQYRQRDAVVQHGSLSYDLTVDRHLGVFAADLDPDRFRERVTGIRPRAGIGRETAVAALEATLADRFDATPGGWTDAELERAADIAERKYASDTWTRERVDPL